jgi:hypothetical protein
MGDTASANKDSQENVSFLVQVPKTLAEDLARRAAAFNLSRNQFIRIVSEAALRDPRPLIVYTTDQEPATEPIELTPEAHQFLLSALPEMIEFERRLRAKGPLETIEIPKPVRAAKRSELWELFEEERGEILRLKWIESEKAGHDIGMEAALRVWLQQHHDKWAAGRKPKD